jgi:selenoprotein W-related protein
LAERLLKTYKQAITELELQPSGGGCFEVSIDGELIYSKLASGEFPDEDEMVTQAGLHVSA